jgi:hypothetical protein
LTLADNAPNSPQTVALTGTAMDFCFSSPSGQSAIPPIAPGQTATYSLQVNSFAGFAGTVTLGCSGAPAEAACSVTPTVSVAPNAPGPFTVTVTTTATSPSSGLAPGSWHRHRAPESPLLVVAILAGICTLIGASWPRKRGFAIAKAIQAASLVLVLAAGLAACGGGGASDPDPGTLPGTYTITVTATVTASSTTVTRTVPLQLVVQPAAASDVKLTTRTF